MSLAVSTPIMEAAKRLLRVALIGAPNAGKSTLVNKLIMSEVSCVSNKVHTTRRNMLGFYTDNHTQLEFYDSPGIVSKQHMLKHHLEDSLLRDPCEATQRCDLIAVVVDASNKRECNKMNRRILKMLEEYSDKKSFLVLNKVDLVKDKRMLLDIGARLSDGHLDGERLRPERSLRSEHNKGRLFGAENLRRGTSKFVIELDPERAKQTYEQELEQVAMTIGYRNFSQIFSISALNDDGVDELRESLIANALPVERWPHGPDIVTNQNSREVVHEIVRGRVMDNVEHEIPYVVKYKYLECRYDEWSNLHVNIDLVVPQKYQVGKLLGEHGVTIFKIINESREAISRTLGCDCKLHIGVRSSKRSS